jgi:DNA-binding NtrC family response regulator
MANSSYYRVLCVDRAHSCLRAWKASLTEYGAEVITATHENDAVMQFKGQKGFLRAIIVDHDLSGMGAAGLVARFRESGYVGCVAVTFQELSLIHIRNYTDFRVQGFFHKPFKASMLAPFILANC